LQLTEIIFITITVTANEYITAVNALLICKHTEVMCV